MRYILGGIIGRHRSQPDVHIPAVCRRTVTTVIRVQLHDFADPPYGLCMFNASVLAALRFARAAPFSSGPTRRMSWLYSAAAMVRSASRKAKSKPARCEAALLDA